MPGLKWSRSSANWRPRDETSTEAVDSRAARLPGEAYFVSIMQASRLCGGLIASARNHKGFIVEPQASVLPQRPVGGFEIAPVAHRGSKPLVLDLRHIDGCVPGCEQRRRADRAADLIRQRVHVVFENRSGVGGRVEIVMARGCAEFVFDLSQDGVSIGCEGVLSRPYIVDDLKARVASMRMDADQPAARPQGLDERRNNLRSLEFEARPSAVRLGGNDQIIVRSDSPRTRQNWVEEKGMILAPQRQDDRPEINGIA